MKSEQLELLNLPTEMILSVLEEMTYPEIRQFCSASSELSALCSDTENPIGNLYSKKKQDEAVILIQTYDTTIDALHFTITFYNNDSILTSSTYTLWILNELAEKFISCIDATPDIHSQSLTQTMDGKRVTITITPDGDTSIEIIEPFPYSDDELSFYVDTNFFIKLLKLLLKMHRAGIMDNHLIFVYEDQQMFIEGSGFRD